jgi:hypothetical protein
MSDPSVTHTPNVAIPPLLQSPNYHASPYGNHQYPRSYPNSSDYHAATISPTSLEWGPMPIMYPGYMSPSSWYMPPIPYNMGYLQPMGPIISIPSSQVLFVDSADVDSSSTSLPTPPTNYSNHEGMEKKERVMSDTINSVREKTEDKLREKTRAQQDQREMTMKMTATKKETRKSLGQEETKEIKKFTVIKKMKS